MRPPLTKFQLEPDLDALTPFARWMPAFKQPRKFDTMFFLAPAPAGDLATQSATRRMRRCRIGRFRPSCLERIDRGDASTIFPTKRNLERLARHAALSSALSDAKAHSLETIIPWVEEIDGIRHVRIPEGRGYPVISEPLATAFRA